MKPFEILIVEDEPSIAEVVALYLRRAGFQAQVEQEIARTVSARPGGAGCNATGGRWILNSALAARPQ